MSERPDFGRLEIFISAFFHSKTGFSEKVRDFFISKLTLTDAKHAQKTRWLKSKNRFEFKRPN
jgi:hypothetical protein